jgi:hypothetical protein
MNHGFIHRILRVSSHHITIPCYPQHLGRPHRSSPVTVPVSPTHSSWNNLATATLRRTSPAARHPQDPRARSRGRTPAPKNLLPVRRRRRRHQHHHTPVRETSVPTMPRGRHGSLALPASACAHRWPQNGGETTHARESTTGRIALSSPFELRTAILSFPLLCYLSKISR